MKSFLFASTLFAASAAFAYKPAVEQEFSDVAASGCRNRDGDFIIRGMVSSATEDTVVLSDPDSSRSTISVTLPGRGFFARARGVFGKSKHETTDDRLNELREARTPVIVTLKCKGAGTPVARNISYEESDGGNASISF
jgi:hypothetical protein